MGNVPFFGLPGNPIATAGCFRFLVVPYLKDIMGQAYEEAQPTKLHQRNGSRDAFLSSPVHLDCFRHGTLQDDGYGTNMVELSSNQSPAIISQFAASNCWVHIPKGRPVELRDAMVYCYPHKPSFD
jgi:molybdopterin molybdotransferase